MSWEGLGGFGRVWCDERRGDKSTAVNSGQQTTRRWWTILGSWGNGLWGNGSWGYGLQTTGSATSWTTIAGIPAEFEKKRRKRGTLPIVPAPHTSSLLTPPSI